MNKIRVLAAVTAAVLLFPLRVNAGLPDELVPTYSTTYEDLKILVSKGLVPAEPANTRPLARKQIAGILAQGLRGGADLLGDPVGLRLVREFAAELEAMGVEVPGRRHGPFWQRRISSAGNGARVEIVPYAWVRVDNVEPIYFRALADRRIGFGGSYSTAGGMLVIHDDLTAGSHSEEPRGIPDFGTLNALVEGEDFNSWVHRAYIRLNTKILDVVFGRDWLRWGPGRTGTLGLGDAAPALNHLLLKKRTDKFDFTTFVAALDFGDEEMLAGHRLEFRAAPNVTVGVAEQVRFRSLQQAPLYLLSFYPYSLVEKVVHVDSRVDTSRVDEDRRNNVMWTVDVDWLPARRTRLYGELLIDDLSFSRDEKPTQIGYQLGLMRTGLAGMDFLTLEAEFTKIHGYTYSQARRSAGADTLELDFVRRGYSLGHPIGPDSEAYFFAARYDASASCKWELTVEVRRSGELDLGDGWIYGDPVPGTFSLSGVVETKTRVMLEHTFRPGWWHGSWLTVGGGLYRAANTQNREGEGKGWDGIMQASLMASW